MSGGVLVTGAGGFVGAHVAAGLARLGWRVCALDRRFDERARRRLTAVELVEGEMSTETLAGTGSDFDAIVHAAALTTPPERLGLTAAAFVRANLEPLLAALDFAACGGARRVVFLSSSGVFAAEGSTPVLLEGSAPDACHAYGAAKRMGELATATLLPAGCALTVRLGPVYGPDEVPRDSRMTVSPVARWIAEAQAGGPVAVDNRLSRRDWTYAPDLGPALDALLAAKADGLLHLTSGETFADEALAGLIARRHAAAVRVADPPAAPARRPMGTQRPELAGFPWTPMADGLDELLPRRTAA